jgi:hypothetical protein
MNAEQKRAWIIMVVVTSSLIAYVTLLPSLGTGAAGAFGLCGLLGFLPLIGRKDRADERDRSIARRGTLAGGMASYTAFLAGCMGTWWVAYAWHGRDEVSVHIMGLITCIGMITLFTVRSIVILVLYARHVEADNA